MKQVIVGLGEALWDCLPEGKKLGGAPANFAYHAGQFGHDSLAVSAVGNDALGQETLDEFDKKGVKYMMPEVDYQTGTVLVELDDEAYLPITSRRMWHGTIFRSSRSLKKLPETAVPCVSVRWHSAAA